MDYAKGRQARSHEEKESIYSTRLHICFYVLLLTVRIADVSTWPAGLVILHVNFPVSSGYVTWMVRVALPPSTLIYKQTQKRHLEKDPVCLKCKKKIRFRWKLNQFTRGKWRKLSISASKPFICISSLTEKFVNRQTLVRALYELLNQKVSKKFDHYIRKQ